MTKLPPFVSNLVAVRRNPWILGIAASPIGAALALFVGGLVVRPALFAFVFHALVFGVAGLLLAWRKNYRPLAVPVEVRVGALGVTVGDRFIPRAEIREGFVLPGAPPRVLLRRRRRPAVELQAGSTEEARGLLRALGLDVSQTVAEFHAYSRALAKRRYGVAVGAGIGAFYVGLFSALGIMRGHPTGGALLFLMAVIPLLTLTALALARTRLRVGADGIALRWLWTKRFVGYDQIAEVSRYEKAWGRSQVIGVRIVLRSGEEVLVPVQGNNWSSDQTAIIEERVREAMDSYQKGDVAADTAMLRRGGREVRDWATALRSIGAGANAGMRTPPVPRERLFRIVEDPAAAPPERAAAAVALGGELDDDGRARLRAAADATAAPRLRIAIEKAASGADEAEVEAALAEVAAEQAEDGEATKVAARA